MLNKKSQVEDWLSLVFIIAAIVIVVFVLSLINISKKNSSNEYASVLVMEKDANQLLHNYLSSSPGAVDSNNRNTADVINTYFTNEDPKYLSELNQITNDFLSNSEIETDYSTWSLEMKFNDKEITLDSERARKSRVLRREIARTIIPSYLNSGPIEIRLFEVTTKFVG